MGWLNYTGRIADSPDYYAENADDYPDAPDYDERDAVFAQIASEDGWVVATPEAFVDRGISLKAMAESMRRASQALSANGGTDAPDGKDECQPSFTPDLS